MGFDYDCDVRVTYAMELPVIECPRAFAVRCLLKFPKCVEDKPNKRQKAQARRPMTDMHALEVQARKDGKNQLKFEDVITEASLAPLSDAERCLYEELRVEMHGVLYDKLEGEDTNKCELVNKAFQVFADRVLPGHGHRFGLEVINWSGVDPFYGGTGRTAKRKCAYLYATETVVTQEAAEEDQPYQTSRGNNLSMPWGVKLTEIPIPKDLANLEAMMRTLVERMHLTSQASEPAFQLITNASGG